MTPPGHPRARGRRFRAVSRSRRIANCRRGASQRRRVWRRAVIALGIPAGAALVFLGIRAIFDGDPFRVREITFRGLVNARAPVLAAEAGLARRRSIFEDFSFVEYNLRRDPLVASAAVRRDLPRRLIVEIEERVPVAYWSEAELWPVDAEGRILPLDPAHFGWDLPVLIASPGGSAGPSAVQAGRLVDANARALLRLMIGIRDRVPEIARRISVAELEPEGGIVLQLMGGGRMEPGEVRLRLETPLEKVALLPDVLRDLDFRRTAFKSLDLSFDDQIVVVPAELPSPARAPGAPADEPQPPLPVLEDDEAPTFRSGPGEPPPPLEEET